MSTVSELSLRRISGGVLARSVSQFLCLSIPTPPSAFQRGFHSEGSRARICGGLATTALGRFGAHGLELDCLRFRTRAASGCNVSVSWGSAVCTCRGLSLR